MTKIKTSAIVASIGVLLAASGITGYKLVKTKNYGAIQENLHAVVRVVDGDTFEVEGERKDEVVTVRILNVDAPERGECFFDESKNALEKLIGERKVKLVKDVSGADSYGRLLRHVFVPSGTEKEDDLMVSKDLIENGFVRALPVYPNIAYKDYLIKFETSARKNEKGAWGKCQDNLPKNFQDASDAQPGDADCVIKGNISAVDRERRYFLPECPSYSQIKIDLKKGEAYFCSEEEAQKAGFTISDSCENIFK